MAHEKSGRTSYFTLGEWPTLTVKQARSELAKRSGRATPSNALLVRDALEEWYRLQIEPRYRVTKNIRTYVDRASVEFGARRLQELTRAEIARFVRGYAKATPVAANRCLAAIKLALGWCVESGYLDHSPAAGLTTRIAGGKEPTRRRVLYDAEIIALWRLESPNANLLRALLLAGCRIGELQRAAVEHIFAGAAEIQGFSRDPHGDWLMIPAQHSKNGRAHYVFITPELRAQFNAAKNSGDESVTTVSNVSPAGGTLLFRSVSPTAVQAWVRRLQIEDEAPRDPWASIRPIDKETGEPMPAWTPHDLRRTFSTRLGDLGVAPHIIEKLLNHTPEGVAGIYNRAELLTERVEAMKRWTAELMRLVTSNTADGRQPS